MTVETTAVLKNVSKQVGNRKIIDGLDLSVQKGEILGLLGPNGAGKTTTIRMMVGLISITEGDVSIHGKSITKQFEQAIQHVGAIVENPEMYKFLTGYQNLIHYARMSHGITKERINEVIQLVGLQNRIHDKVKKYSLGMRQRLGVAQALLHQPSLLILDEPTNGLDPAGIRELRDYLRQLVEKKGLSVIVSSHLLSEMELMCDRVAIIQEGKLIDVRHIKTNESVQQYIVEVDDVEKAKQAIEQLEQEMNLEMRKEHIVIDMEKEHVPAVVQTLVQHHIDIYSIIPATKTLEDQFLEVTGGKEIV
ncbi:ABC transporter ATP-binding protein [Longirhabdus pacifica]|uniref:ABC transporter ATP-binding protein n=1 Tax=Longirhabdus pacifica TaxID=2305227 RepID=UPI0010091ACE|nr:ABC transporter ATP-binding protein [Longirhabdus pacifica]